jgi:hypothetical protein
MNVKENLMFIWFLLGMAATLFAVSLYGLWLKHHHTKRIEAQPTAKIEYREPVTFLEEAQADLIKPSDVVNKINEEAPIIPKVRSRAFYKTRAESHQILRETEPSKPVPSPSPQLLIPIIARLIHAALRHHTCETTARTEETKPIEEATPFPTDPIKKLQEYRRRLSRRN